MRVRPAESQARASELDGRENDGGSPGLPAGMAALHGRCMRRILGSAGRASEEGGAPVGSGDRTDNAVRMEEAIHGYIAACNTGDAEAIAAFFAPGAVHYFPPG